MQEIARFCGARMTKSKNHIQLFSTCSYVANNDLHCPIGISQYHVLPQACILLRMRVRFSHVYKLLYFWKAYLYSWVNFSAFLSYKGFQDMFLVHISLSPHTKKHVGNHQRRLTCQTFLNEEKYIELEGERIIGCIQHFFIMSQTNHTSNWMIMHKGRGECQWEPCWQGLFIDVHAINNDWHVKKEDIREIRGLRQLDQMIGVHEVICSIN